MCGCAEGMLRDLQPVELVEAYSNHSGTSEELADLCKWIAKSPVRRDARRVRRQKLPRKLSDEEISQLVQGYRVGLTVYELATQFGIHSETVAGILKREGVPRQRRHTLTISDRESLHPLQERPVIGSGGCGVGL